MGEGAWMYEDCTFGGHERRGGQEEMGRQLGSPSALALHATAPCASAMCHSTALNTIQLGTPVT